MTKRQENLAWTAFDACQRWGSKNEGPYFIHLFSVWSSDNTEGVWEPLTSHFKSNVRQAKLTLTHSKSHLVITFILPLISILLKPWTSTSWNTASVYHRWHGIKAMIKGTFSCRVTNDCNRNLKRIYDKPLEKGSWILSGWAMTSFTLRKLILKSSCRYFKSLKRTW